MNLWWQLVQIRNRKDLSREVDGRRKAKKFKRHDGTTSPAPRNQTTF